MTNYESPTIHTLGTVRELTEFNLNKQGTQNDQFTQALQNLGAPNPVGSAVTITP